jgi:hypothetical protein
LDSPTLIAKILPTFAGHIVTPSNFFDPKGTFWTLFDFLPFNKIQELFIDFKVCVTYSVLGTSLPFVLNYFTIQTVVLLAAWAYKILVIFFKEKNIFTVRSGTPRYIIILIGSLIKRFLIELFHRRLSKYSSHI